jgi:serine/threonine protein phosphatase 1
MLGLARSRDAVGEPVIDGRPPAVAPGSRIYAVGDVHGRLDLLTAIEEIVLDDARRRPAPAGTTIVHLGDLVDRGPDSRGVLARLAVPLPPPVRRVLLCGNHDDWLRQFLAGGRCDPDWIDQGGLATLTSYGVDWRWWLPSPQRAQHAREALGRAMPPAHRRVLAGLQPMWRCGDYLFAHAGIRPGRALDRQVADDLYWIREPFLSWPGPLGAVVVHGHTVVEQPVLRPNRIAIDTGAVWTGRLTCLVLEGDERRFLSAGG